MIKFQALFTPIYELYETLVFYKLLKLQKLKYRLIVNLKKNFQPSSMNDYQRMKLHFYKLLWQNICIRASMMR